MSQINLTASQLKSVQEYCKLNNIEDIDKFISKCFTEGYNINKYGLLNGDSEKIGVVEEKRVEIEVIKEIRVEVPVEVIKEVRVEIPVTNLDNICDKPEPIIVEKIVEVIKEVPVEKIVEVEKPNDKVLLLQQTLQTLKKELSLKDTRIEELENKNKQLESNNVNQKAVYLKGSNLNETM